MTATIRVRPLDQSWQTIGTLARFAWLKATEGESFTDQHFRENVRRARAAGLVVGAYHFVTAAPASAQARHFHAVMRAAGVGKGGLLPVADVEKVGVSSPTVQKGVLSGTRRWLCPEVTQRRRRARADCGAMHWCTDRALPGQTVGQTVGLDALRRAEGRGDRHGRWRS